jgi:hypothetical protein
VSLKPDLFEGLRFDLTKPLNHNFALSHSIFMGNVDVPTANSQARTLHIKHFPLRAAPRGVRLAACVLGCRVLSPCKYSRGISLSGALIEVPRRPCPRLLADRWSRCPLARMSLVPT